jgi:[ribosomal protein S18]-alanine N-acetyltransferase
VTQIVRAFASTALVLEALHAKAFRAAWSAKVLAELIETPGAFAWIAQRLDAPDGFVLGRVAADEAEIITLAVRPTARRAGVGRALMAAAMACAREAGAARMFLEVAEDNPAGRALYDALGFEQVGVRPHYYDRPDGAFADARILARALL